MSITDDVRAVEPRAPAASSTVDNQFDRTPPQDNAAEQCVLGGMLLSKDAIADVVEILRSSDFYRPAHAVVFDAILDLYGRGEPADPITLAAALTDAGDIGRVGGVPYLHTLVSAVPTAANSAYYARIVAERAVLRRLVEAGTRIVQLGYGAAAGAGRDVDDIVDLAQQAVYDVTERRVSEDFAVLSDLLQPTLDEIEAVGSQGGVMTGVPTGFTDLDRLLNGLHPGQLIVVAGRPGLGKALALDTPLPTPSGWTTMGRVQVGDELVGADGRPTRVLAVSDVMHGRRCYEVEFSDGTIIVADAEHQWRTTTHSSRHQRVTSGVAFDPPRSEFRNVLVAYPDVVTTEQIAATLRHGADRRLNHAVGNCRPLALPEVALPVPPYTLGRWLAEERWRSSGPRVDIGVLGDKHIPASYLRASEAQRRSLLAGLMDSNGTVAPGGDLQFTATSRRLAVNVYELIVSLGYRCTVTATAAKGRHADGSTAYTLTFAAADELFRLERKRCAHDERRRTNRPVRPAARYIVDVRPAPSVPVRCVSVDNDDHLYLASRSMIPTHNSTASMDFARNSAIRYNLASAVFSLEMSKVEIVMRLLSAEARVPLHVLRSGQLSDDDWTKLARRMGEISEAPLYVDDTPNMNLMEIRAKARRLKQRHDLKLVIVDYLQLMTSPKRVESRQQEVAELSRGLKLLAKEIECPVVAVSQLNRGPEQRTDKRPQLSDLRESGCLTAATRIIRADNNAEVPLGELLASGARDVPVWALDERLKYVPRTMTHVFRSGRREVFRLRLASGKEIEATANHPFLTVEGWRPLGELAVGSRIATPRHIPPRLSVAAGKVHRPRYTLDVSGRDQLRFLHEIGGHRERSGSGELAAGAAKQGERNTNVDTVPREVWGRVRDILVEPRSGGSTPRTDAPDRSRLARIAGVLGSAGVELYATNDVFWDKVALIEPIGPQDVFDATVPGGHNFIANGIAVHNSIEQDADVVILLHRDDYYDKESPRAGEADFIVAKHRNGPTDTITVAAQLHMSRFVDMAIP